MAETERVLVSGASGFLGRECCATLAAIGYSVTALVRRPESCRDLCSVAAGGVYRCELPHNFDLEAFRQPARALVHCAYETRSASRENSRRTNVDGTKALVEAARGSGIRHIVFISSLAAHAEAKSIYGCTKYELESLFGDGGSTVIKPATIIGPGGVFQRVREVVRTLPVIPLFYCNRTIQTIWIGDICAAIAAVIQRSVPGTVVAAHPEAIPIRDFYSEIAGIEKKRARFLSFRGDLALLGIRALESAGIKPPISSDNILGMKYLQHVDPRDDLHSLGIQPLSFLESIEKVRGAF